MRSDQKKKYLQNIVIEKNKYTFTLETVIDGQYRYITIGEINENCSKQTLMMDANTYAPRPQFRSISTTSNLSLSSSSSSITRVALAPIQAMGNSFNRAANSEDSLYYQSSRLKQRLESIEEMKPFLAAAFEVAEQSAEQQALALSQQLQEEAISSGDNEFRASMGSGGFSIHSDTSSMTSVGTNSSPGNANNNIFTFTAGVLPANIGVDPATHLWKMFQQGSSLCALFNCVVSDYSIPIVGSDDLRVCKKSVYDFLIAVKMHLNFEDDSMFTISDVFLDNTHDLLKVLKVVNKLVSLKTSKNPVNFEVGQLAIGELAISDDRSKVLKEMIETERKYVQDLELLLAYRNDLQNAELVSSELIHILFPNLNEIIDFQRRFLNGLECNVNIPHRYQRIGSIFIHAAGGPFRAYEPWTIGQISAIDLINKELINLKKSSTLLDPGFELQSYIIKPIQRLCKYPLLLKELIKNSPESISDSNNSHSAAYNELILANSAVKEVANQVNEAQRRSENVGYLQSLIERVNNWRGFNLKDQGELLHHGVVGVKDAENEKEYFAYLFEKIIFFFIDGSNTSKDKEGKKKRDILSSRKKSQSSSTTNLLDTLNHAKDKYLLELKGRVYILEIYNISISNSQGYTLVISWSGKKESGSFTLRYRTEELRNQWEKCLRTLKTNEMNNQIHRKLRDSHGSLLTNDSSGYDGSYGHNSHDGYSSRSSNGSTYQRHHSSSSTFSMMRQSRSKSSSDHQNARTSSSSLSNSANNAFLDKNEHSFLSASSGSSMVAIKLVYNKIEIQGILLVSTSIQFTDLHLKISSKIAASNEVNDDILVNKLKYKDEDGDFVVMDSNDDWTLAIDTLDELNENNESDERIVTIWAS